MRISRPIAGQSNFAFDVDVQAVLDGSAEHNYQLFPGDRIFVEKITKKKNLVTAPKKDDSKSALPVPGMGVSAGSGSPHSYFVSYPVKDIIPRLREKRNLSESEAQKFLEQTLKRSATYPDDSKQLLETIQSTWRYDGEEVVINTNCEGHERIVQMLDIIRRHGSLVTEIEVRFVTLSLDKFKEVLPDWMVYGSDDPEATHAVNPAMFEHPVDDHSVARVSQAKLLKEKASPVRFRIVDKELGLKLLDRWQADPQTKVLKAPKVKAFNGQPSIISDTVQKPFVVGLKEVKPGVNQPQIRIVSEGRTLDLRPVIDQPGSIKLEVSITNSVISCVETKGVTCTDGNQSKITAQLPEVKTAKIEVGAVLKQNEWLLLGRLDRKNKENKTEVITVSWEPLGPFIPPKRSNLP